MNRIPRCPTKLPSDIAGAIYELGRMWAQSESFPVIQPAVCKSWMSLIEEWIGASDLPLLVRKSSHVRGSEITHRATKRALVICDNSPAQWACHLALRGLTPRIDEIRADFMRDRIPLALAHDSSERAKGKYHCTLRGFTVNKANWKLCHILPVGLRSRQALEDQPIESLETAFRNLLAPSNFFLVPKCWGGLGEAREFINGVTKRME